MKKIDRAKKYLRALDKIGLREMFRINKNRRRELLEEVIVTYEIEEAIKEILNEME